ncbi:MAG: phage holin family protein [Hylemonella sp.]|nr:phage holin family protein [Hylemonella sp.]
MSAPPQGAGLLVSLRQLLGTAVATVQVRLALLGNELEEEKLRLFDSLLWAALALVLLALGSLLLAAFIVVLFWDSHRLQALGGLAVLLLGAGAGLLVRARARLRQPGGLFRASVNELDRDRVGLGASDPGP